MIEMFANPDYLSKYDNCSDDYAIRMARRDEIRDIAKEVVKDAKAKERKRLNPCFTKEEVKFICRLIQDYYGVATEENEADGNLVKSILSKLPFMEEK